MAQSRLLQLIDHLFATSANALVLESNTTGMWLQSGAASLPAFRQPLRTGQILLLLSDVVPKDQSNQLLSGTPTRFTLALPQGEVAIHITLTGDDVRAEIIPVVAVAAGRAPGPAAPTVSETQTVEVPTALMVMLKEMIARRASHLHLMPEAPVFARVDGQLQAQPDFSPWSSAAIHDAVVNLAPVAMREKMKNSPHIELTHLSEDSVFHVQANVGAEGYSLTARCLPRAVPTLRTLRLPGEISSMRGPGLWVIAGAARQGSSSTLASMLQAALSSAPQSVLMLESPAGLVLAPGQGMVQHLEVGPKHASWSEALARARASDFDVVAISSLDDAEALRHAVMLADQGRMVIGALHADSTVGAVEKLLSLSAGPRLSSVIRGVFAQRLMRTVDGERSVAWEYLPCHSAARAEMRTGSLASLASMRSHSFDDSLCELVRSSSVELNDALEAAEDQQQLRARLSLQSVA